MSSEISAFIDTDIWHQTFPRYLCLNLHKIGLCNMYYSDKVMEELFDSLVNKAGMKQCEAKLCIKDIQSQLPNSEVYVMAEYEQYSKVHLPKDDDDKHVLYATSKIENSDFLVTRNIKDFDMDDIRYKANNFLNLPDKFKVISLDDFLCTLYYIDKNNFIKALVDTLVPMEKGKVKRHLDQLRSDNNCHQIIAILNRDKIEIEELVIQARSAGRK